MSEKTAVEYLEWIKLRSWNVEFMNTCDLRKFLDTAIVKVKEEQSERTE